MGPCARWRCFLARSVAAPALWGVLRGRRGALSGLRICPVALSFGDREPLASARRGEIAQLVEHTTENRGVPGSIPGLAIDSRLERRGFSLGACRAGIVVCSGGHVWCESSLLSGRGGARLRTCRASAGRPARRSPLAGTELAPAPPSAGQQDFRPVTYSAADVGEPAGLASGEFQAY